MAIVDKAQLLAGKYGMDANTLVAALCTYIEDINPNENNFCDFIDEFMQAQVDDDTKAAIAPAGYGYNAFYAGTPEADNPYAPNTPEWGEWHQGWSDGYCDAFDAKEASELFGR